MERGDQKFLLPNPHVGVISGGFLTRLLRQAGITAEEWENTR
jgi:hypothetical protein